ncbi:uncharacterized protein LOC123509836 isoform X4 [Portunus trituberculatus]|uniref:uncharacterized protein LOC123509836 isoform X4 n=1 Tax=Portunus trituberculatus TaxID=210409 RepID=UPI001E1D046B|nr:uncharacterized protein LOC123509836 isoform X4 [Portunus trituberculatus]
MLSVGGGWRWCWRGAAGEGGWCGSSAPSVAAMIHYTLEPQFNALIFSVSARHERFTLLPDPFVCCAHGPPAGATDLLAYLHAVGVQLATLGDHYACLLTQVRAGSVIFLVGVGSLVCWKLWEHWRSGAGTPSVAPPTPPTSPAQRRPRGLLASLLEEDLVQDSDEIDDEDPAFIHGKYFGPDSPCAEAPLEDCSPITPITDFSEASTSEARCQHYLADASASLSANDGAQSSSENSLPTDGESDAELFPGTKRLVKRKHRASELQRNQANHRQCSPKPRSRHNSVNNRRHKGEARVPNEGQGSAMTHNQQTMWLSSESSPEYVRSAVRSHGLASHQTYDLETPDSEEVIDRIRRDLRGSQHGRVGDYNGPWHADGSCLCCREQPDGEEVLPCGNISSTSLSDLMDKIRHRAARGSISRDASITSNLSEMVSMPHGSRRLFKREDSVCSNLSGVSDLAPSECSEMSLDVSVQEDLASLTFTCFNNIEHELDDLKSSMLEMDEEVTKFVARPDPYSFKTTFSDYSMGSGESRPSSAMEILSAHRSRANLRLNLQPARPNTSSDSEVVEGGTADASLGSNHLVSGSEAEGSLEWDSPQHGWTSAKAPVLSKLQELPSEDAESSHASMQDDAMLSLEWDNDCLHQYEDEVPLQDSSEHVFQPSTQDSLTELEGFQEYKIEFGRHQLLPDHSSLELDLEEELMSTTGGVEDMVASPFCNAPMTISIDSAIHSGTGSRSASSSPVPSGMGHSLLSSSGLASSSEISPATPDSEGTGWLAWERRLSPGEFGSKARRYWSSEESGYVEGLEAPLDNIHPHLSPVHEIKEKENSDSNTSTPRHISSWESLNNNTTPNNNTNTIINTNENQANNKNITPVMGNKTSSLNDNSWSTPTTTTTTTTTTSPDQSTNGLGTSSAIGPKLELMKYANNEWQGNTLKAQTIKQGYSAISMELNIKHLRQVRGDNYCGVRAALYQILARGLAVPSGHTTHSRLASELTQGATWLRDWTFGHRLNYSREDVLNGFLDCLDALDSLILNLMGCENRECVVLARVNRDPLLDVRLCEAVKLHMLAAALDLHAANTCGESVPLFAMIMFARHSSMTPRDLMKNHLNPVGDTAGLEQDQHKVEMFLLGHTLGVTLQVVRPASYGEDDFICYYPDSNIGLWPEVTLVAEDDRHYNVLIK